MIIQIEPWIDNTELEQLKRVVDSTFVTEHELTKEFEQITMDLAQSKHAMATCNGTAALFMALKAIDVGPGDEVIVPDMTFIASANCVIMAGATPILCDVKRDTYCIDPEKIEELINENTKAIIPVHLYGQSAEMDSILKIANKHNLKVIEDAAQGVGVKYKGKHTGTLGDIGILSYYGNKTITTGEGGVLLTQDDELAKKLYRLKNHGRDQKGTFIHEHIGFNFSFTEMQAAIGIAQMAKLSHIIETKQKIKDKYYAELSNIDGLKLPYISPDSSPVHWFTSIEIDQGADDLANYLKEKGIQTRRFFYPLHKQPCYKTMLGNILKGEAPKISSELFNKCLSLPSAVNLSAENQEYVINEIKKFFANRN